MSMAIPPAPSGFSPSTSSRASCPPASGTISSEDSSNAFIDDIYHDQKILRDGVIPRDVVLSAVSYRKQCHGLNPPWRVWCHVTGTDLVRDRDGVYYVLEDNLRVPSGVSYVLENREVLKTIFPAVFEGLSVRPVNDYPSHLLEMLESIAPGAPANPSVDSSISSRWLG